MKQSSFTQTSRTIPLEYRPIFWHLYLDIAWFGVLMGSAMAFAVVYAARLGADALQVGLISAGPAMINLCFTLPFGRWLEHRPIARVVFWSSVLHRIFFGLWVVLPILFLPHAQIWALILLTLVMSVPATVLAIGFNTLFAEAVSTEWRGHVTGIRNSLLAGTVIITSLLCGLILEKMPFPAGYQVVFGLGFLGAAMSSFHLWFVRPGSTDRALPNGRALGDLARPGIFRSVGDGLRAAVGLRYLIHGQRGPLLRLEILKGSFGKVIAVLFAFHLMQYAAIPLFPLYWVSKLHLSDQQISYSTMLFYLTILLVSLQLGALTDKMGNQRVTALGAMIMSGYPALTAASQGLGLILVASVAGGVGWALAGGALNNYVLDRVPDSDRPAHLAWYNLAFNAAILLGSLSGPLLAGTIGLSLALSLIAVARLVTALSMWRWG